MEKNFPESKTLSNSEYIWKENITDNDADDTMEFSIWKRYVFRPDLSNGLTGDEIVTILHPGDYNHLKSIPFKYS